ncbi:heme/hemin ABC transporter substrate-binding protein [Methylomonas fluvii]|uniref:Hemin ABC transporter substrate-binding protein n=1 Tax=Methylomonas fluvii TaxID=1854564 RepID=A0ABR9DJY9_9GAMM|nr:hemin ABC transporter substrate-binding protein [Methylomonas fluvii]MBD9363421.1 hemin ABC transporter substrate-binding protein [Methylomonas fluvii]CAD6876704.1 ABC transporter, substrate-binding protein (cluster 8, B12/iron complex) [Methylomonas fluvii]
MKQTTSLSHKLARAACAALLWLTAAAPAHAAGPSRIVSVGGALTEIVYALDGAERLVGVDSTSLMPAAAKVLPQVGYMRSLSAEGVLSLRPDLLLASAHAGPPAVLEQLRAAGVRIETLAEDYSAAGITAKIGAVAALLDKPEQGLALAGQVQADFDRLAQWRAQRGDQPKVLFLMAVAHGALLASGRGTAADAVLTLAGAANAAGELQGNKPIGTEAMVAAAPDVILLTDVAANAIGGLEAFYQQAGIAQTPAGRQRKVLVVDTLALLGFGLHSGQAVLDLAKQLHGEPAVAADAGDGL